MKIDEIQNGIVLDHIKAGKGLEIYNILKLGECDNQVALIQNAKSTKMGKKDVLKIDTEDFEINLDAIAYIDSNLTVNIIKDGKKFDKKCLELPERITDVVKCKNPNCITNHENVPNIFTLVDKEKGTYRCLYCETKASE